MDIEDILDSITHRHRNQQGVESNETFQQQDLQLLTRAWISERVAPDLLHYPHELMKRVTARLRAEIDIIEERAASMDAGISFPLVVQQTELERFKYLARSFLRTRVAKIDAHPLHTLNIHETDRSGRRPNQRLLSPSEAQYVRMHCTLLNAHYSASFLSAFPQKLQRVDDRAGASGVSMIEPPDTHDIVVLRCLGRVRGEDALHDDISLSRSFMSEVQFEAISIACGYIDSPSQTNERNDGDIDSRQTGKVIEKWVRMKRGDIWMVTWSRVREIIAANKCELL